MKYKLISLALISLSLFTNCTKKEETTPASTNIATEVVANLSAISANYSPSSLTAASVHISSDPCEGVSDFAVCQSNLVRAYNKLGKDAVDNVSQLVNTVGTALGNIPDGNAGTSEDGKVTWNKTSTAVWSVLFRGTNLDPLAYISINNGVYTVKYNKNVDTDPKDQRIEINVTFTNSNTWNVDVFFINNVCDSADAKAPTRIRVKVALADNLWTGKAMVYSPRWQGPGAATVTCATNSEIAMYTDYVGNTTSTKASIYLIPGTNNDLSTISNFALTSFCTNFGASCGGGGQPANNGALAAYGNPFCSTAPNTAPTWSNSCTTNTVVNGASYSNASNWQTPTALKAATVTVPTTL